MKREPVSQTDLVEADPTESVVTELAPRVQKPTHLLLVVVAERAATAGASLPLFASSTAALRDHLAVLVVASSSIALTPSERLEVVQHGWAFENAALGGELRPGHIYISSGAPTPLDWLRVEERVRQQDRRTPVDDLLRSVAGTYAELALVVLLSTRGGDGIRGLQAITEAGGTALALNACRQARLADAAGLGVLDELLTLDELVQRTPQHLQRALAARDELSKPASDSPRTPLRSAVVSYFALASDDYRVELLTRRIQRRMRVCGLEQPEDYIRLLDEDSTESSRIVRDLLLRESRFFADTKSVSALEERVLPALIAQKSHGATLRAWVPGCATGEEAYSLAILLSDYVEQANLNSDVRVFATDIDSAALAVARQGWYPRSIEEDVPTAKLKRHFHERDGAYQVSKRTRDCVLFATHRLALDPPFGQLDLISCHGLLNYLSQSDRAQALADFHAALAAHGQLLLGTHDLPSDMQDLFEAVDDRGMLFKRVVVEQRPAARRWTSVTRLRPSEPAPEPSPSFAPESSRQPSGASLDPHADTTLEHLQITNEELWSYNEELTAANRELELLREEHVSRSEQHDAINQQLRADLETLMRQQTRTRAIEEHANLMILVLDAALKIQSFTPGVLQLFKLVASDVGRPLADIAHPFSAQSLLEDLKRSVASNVQVRRPLVAAGRNYLLDMLPLPPAAGTAAGLVLKFQDVTEIRDVEAELRRRLTRLEGLLSDSAAREANGRPSPNAPEVLTRAQLFAAAIAHEITGPLSSIVLGAENAIAQLEIEPPKAKELLLRVRENAYRCGRIVDNVLRLAREEPSVYTLCEFNPIARRAATQVKMLIPSEKLRVAFALNTPDPWLRCNATELEQVFVNLLTNAAQAHGSVCHVLIRSELTSTDLRVFVSDDGPGIAAIDHVRIFEPFFSNRRKSGGTGLGLNLVQRIVQNHGGTISVSSAPGRGATFELRFPRES